MTPAALTALAQASADGGVGRVVAAEAGDLRAARREPLRRVLGRRRFAVIDRLDPAGFEPFAHEGDPAPMGGLGTERDQIGSSVARRSFCR